MLKKQFSSFALVAGIVACLFLSGGIALPGRVSAQNGSESPKIVPLDLKLGLWEVRVHTSTTDLDYSAGEAAVEQLYKNYTPEQRAKGMADLRAEEMKTAEKQKWGSDGKARYCPLKQDFESTSEAGGGSGCSRAVSSTGQELNMHIMCKAADGKLGYEQIAKFERIDAENLQGTIQMITRVAILGTITRSFTGKWISDSCSGPQAGYAAKNGLHPKGPGAVADENPNRIVALINGKEITAREAWNMIKKVLPATRTAYDGRLPHLLHQVYMQNAVAEEAVKLHLDRQAPWKALLDKTKMDDIQGVQNYAGDPNVPPEVWAHWVDDQQHILWNAYFSQPSTKEEKQALMKREQDRYQITVKDPDFFNGVTTP